MKRSKHLTRKMSGWLRAWRIMQGIYGSIDCLDPESGEVWQYMGTAYVSGPLGRNIQVHQFRHRCLNGERAYRDIPALRRDFQLAKPWHVGGAPRRYTTEYGARMATARYGWKSKPVCLEYL